MDLNINNNDIIAESNRRFAAKKREENMTAVPEIYAERMNKALDYEDNGYYIKAMEICREILAEDSSKDSSKDTEAIRFTLARLYPKVLETDIFDSNKRYQQDVEDYFEFLDSLNMDELMQEYLVDTLSKLCSLLDENEWFRPLFKDFIVTVEKKDYITREEFRKTLDSAYASYESTVYFEDARIGIVMKNVLKSGYERDYLLEGMDEGDRKKKKEIDINTNFYYLACYLQDNMEEIKYICENYPHSYEIIEKDIEAVKSDKEKYKLTIIDRLSGYTASGIDKEGLDKALYKAYEYMLSAKPGPTYVHSGRTTFYRGSKKIGRNDPCPCGSGLKYKQCCGK